MPVPDDTASRKKTLWRMIYEGFDKIDGIPTRAEREVSPIKLLSQIVPPFHVVRDNMLFIFI